MMSSSTRVLIGLVGIGLVCAIIRSSNRSGAHVAETAETSLDGRKEWKTDTSSSATTASRSHLLGHPPSIEAIEQVGQRGDFKADVQRFLVASDAVLSCAAGTSEHDLAMSDLARAFESLGRLDDVERQAIARAWERVAENQENSSYGAAMRRSK
jgi:hypothetical protein